MKVKIKKLHPDAVIPSYAKPGDAGMDLTAVSMEPIFGQVTYGTGISIEIPVGYVGLLFPRSSICNTYLTLSNSVGVIDSAYRGEIKAVFNLDEHGEGRDYTCYSVGDRIAQLVIIPYPRISFEEVDELTDTERGTSGYGSSGA